MKIAKRIPIIIHCIVLCFCLKTKAQSNYATITGKLSGVRNGDQIVLSTYKYGWSLADAFHHIDSLTVTNNIISLNIPINNTSVYVSIRFPQHPKDDLPLLFVDKGDDIVFSNYSGKIRFTGRGAAKCQFVYSIGKTQSQKVSGFDLGDPKACISYCLKLDSLRNTFLNELERARKQFTPSDYIRLKSDIIISDEVGKRAAIGWIGDGFNKYPEEKLKLLEVIDSDYNNFHLKNGFWPNYSVSHVFPRYILTRYTVDSCLLQNKTFNFQNYINFLIQGFSGATREKLLVYSFFDYRSVGGQNYSDLLKTAFQYVHSADMVDKLSELKIKYLISTPAYNFSLIDSTNKTWRLANFKDKVVVLDFWFNGCGNCREIKPVLDDIEKSYQGKNVVFIAVNTDRRRDMWMKGIAGGKYTSNYCLQLNTNGKGEDDALCKYYNITGAPVVLLIGKDGKMLSQADDVRADNGAELRATIDKALGVN